MRSFVVASGFWQSIAVVVVVVVDVEQVLNAGNTGTSGAPGLQIEARLLLLLLLVDRLCCCGDENSAAAVVLCLPSFLPLPCALSNKQTSIDKSPAHTPNQTRKINRENNNNNNLNKQRMSLKKKKGFLCFPSCRGPTLRITIAAEFARDSRKRCVCLHKTCEIEISVFAQHLREKFLCLFAPDSRERFLCLFARDLRERFLSLQDLRDVVEQQQHTRQKQWRFRNLDNLPIYIGDDSCSQHSVQEESRGCNQHSRISCKEDFGVSMILR
jgi:hypothetical protein